MPNFSNAAVATSLGPTVEIPGRTDAAYEHVLYGVPEARVDDTDAFKEAQPLPEGFNDDGQKKSPPENNYSNATEIEGLGVDWFEKFHVLPRSVTLGNILSTTTVSFEVYSAFRRDEKMWTSFVNGGGDGVTLSGQPTLPYTFKPQSSGGLSLELEVTTAGQPIVDDTLDFIFSGVPQTSMIPISLRRVVLFHVAPEMPYTETLEWSTDVLKHVDGTEQRISIRKNPRQLFRWNFRLEDGEERSFIHNLISDWQHRIFGLPVWHETTRLSAAASVNDTTITVQSTSYADYRVGGLVVVLDDRNTFDVFELSSLTSTTLTLSSAIQNSYGVGTYVMPLRTAVAKRLISGSRFVSADSSMTIEFRVDDNDADLASTAAFDSFNSKVLINNCNSVRGEMSEQFERDIVVFDNGTGITAQDSPWAISKRITQLALLAKGQQGIWETRQLLHSLRGKQVSFYVCSFSDDFELDTDIAAGTIINVKNVGYTQFAMNRQPRNVIRIVYNDGSADDIRTITDSSEVSSTREALTLDSSLSAHLASTVSRIMFVEEVRFDSDRINIQHEVGSRVTRTTGPIKSVFE